ncbi:MAG TPA: ABC transporter permease [Kineosporiaceae bacterium]|jgi:ABC-2 type transport system permease protein|nr:ABC transporter permease [Kineosporiaceae bacterium]
MSTSEAPVATAARPVAVGVRARRGPSTRLLRSELRLVFGRRRNQALLLALACVPVLIAVAIRLSDGGPRRRGGGEGGGPAFIGQIAGNGLFVAFTALVVTLPLFLPLAVSVAAGEAVAGEASTGTLRNLLVVPVGRTRLLAVKLAGIVAFGVAAALTVAVAGVLIGLALFPVGPVPLLSGGTLSIGEALVRVLLVALYVAAMLAGLAAIGLFASTLTEVPIAAMAVTAITAVVVEILDAVPQIAAIHPYLLTDWWLRFGDLLRDPVVYGDMIQGLLVTAAYVAVFGALAWARLTTKDVSS